MRGQRRGMAYLVDGEDSLTVEVASPQRFEGAKGIAPARFETDLQLEASSGDFASQDAEVGPEGDRTSVV